MSNESSTAWLTVKTGMAGKIGRNGGEIGFRVLRDPNGLHLAMTITSNSGGGCWSPEVVFFDAIERCLPDDRQEPIPTKALAPAYVGKSANNAPFGVAALVALGFLARATENPNRFQIADRWFELKAELLAQDAGEPYVPATKDGKEAITAMTRQDIPGDDETEDAPTGRKGRKHHPRKTAVELDHASAT